MERTLNIIDSWGDEVSNLQHGWHKSKNEQDKLEVRLWLCVSCVFVRKGEKKVPSGRIVWIVKALDNGLVVMYPELSVACFEEMWKTARALTGTFV